MKTKLASTQANRIHVRRWTMMNSFSISLSRFVLIISLYLFVLTSCNPPTTVVSPPENSPTASIPKITCPETSLPWDIEYLPDDSQSIVNQINAILDNTGLAGQGDTILDLSKQYEINPAFALAMFRKEASFADPRYRAYSNNNPGNIKATGDCKGLPANQSCHGIYGEISTDGQFGKYLTMADGIKAYYLLLSSEYKPGTKRNCADIACIISAYAPSSENDTAAYIKQVTKWTQEYQCQIIGLDGPVILATQSSLPAIDTTTVVNTTIPPITVLPTARAVTPFTGAWQNVDPVDGSIITIYLVQTSNQLTGTLEDTYSFDLQPPGYHGNGSGIVDTSTTANILFSNLVRSDGKTATWEFFFELSSENDVLIVSSCYFNNKEDTANCPKTMLRK
jgi:hypothetical protein